MFLVAEPKEPALRGCDPMGCGHYLASRGARSHKGIDFEAKVGSIVSSHVDGMISKIGIPYADPKKSRFKYVEIVSGGVQHRFFYCQPLDSFDIGQRVSIGQPFATVQHIAGEHEGMKNHIHYEVKNSGNYLDPQEYLR